MPLYTYYLMNRDGSVPAFEFEECSDHSAARERALQVLSTRPERVGVEIWCGDQLVAATHAFSQAEA